MSEELGKDGLVGATIRVSSRVINYVSEEDPKKKIMAFTARMAQHDTVSKDAEIPWKELPRVSINLIPGGQRELKKEISCGDTLVVMGHLIHEGKMFLPTHAIHQEDIDAEEIKEWKNSLTDQ